MIRFVCSLSRTAGYASVVRAILLPTMFTATVHSMGQEAHRATERENLGFKGPVRSVRLTVVRPNADPRSATHRELFIESHPDWTVFDLMGRRIEFASAARGDNILAVSKCEFEADGSEVCYDSAGHQHESSEKRTILPDGTRELTSFQDSKMMLREVTQVDERGEFVASRVYLSDGKLSSEYLKLPDGSDESKIYNNGVVVSDSRTRESEDKNRFDRWSYDSDGHLVWSLAISDEGDLLSCWYDIGFKPKVSSSDSLGICRPHLCVRYKFDEEGSGRLEKVVQHTEKEGNLEPEAEEHYNLDGIVDEKAEIRYTRDWHGNWTSRSVFVWDSGSNLMVETERDTRIIEYY